MIHHARENRVGGGVRKSPFAYPRTRGAGAGCARRQPATGRVMHPSPTWPAAGAWKESSTEGARSRRPGLPVRGEASVMAADTPRTAAMAQGTCRSAGGPSGAPKRGPGQKSPHAGAGRQPLDREVRRASQGLSRRPARASWGGAIRPGLPSTAPASPSHLRWAPLGQRGGWRVFAKRAVLFEEVKRARTARGAVRLAASAVA